MTTYFIIYFAVLFIVLSLMWCLEIAYKIYEIRKNVSIDLVENDRVRMMFRKMWYWISWKRAGLRRQRWLKKNLYPPRYHPEHQSLLLVEIGALSLYMGGLDPNDSELARLDTIYRDLYSQLVEKNMPVIDPSIIN